MDLDDEFRQIRELRRSPRNRVMNSAGGIFFLAGAAVAGKCMIWLGYFQPGQTPTGDILDYWPGFLTGGCILGFSARYLSGKLNNLQHRQGIPVRSHPLSQVANHPR